MIDTASSNGSLSSNGRAVAEVAAAGATVPDGTVRIVDRTEPPTVPDAAMDLALQSETEPHTSTSLTFSRGAAMDQMTSSAAPMQAAANPAAATVQPLEQQDNTVAVALVISILVFVALFTLAYVLYQKRRRLCGRRQADKGGSKQPDLSANEALITPVKTNGGVQSVPDGGGGGGGGGGGPGGLVSGPRATKPRQAVPRKWYDSAAMKYMDQSTDTLDRV